MRLNLRSGTSIAFTFLAFVVVSQAFVFWLPFWKETTVFRYHPKKGWTAIKHSGSPMWKPKKPLRIPPLLLRHHHPHHIHNHPPHHPHDHHHHLHPHSHFRARGPHILSPLHMIHKFKHWKPVKSFKHIHHRDLGPHHHHHHHRVRLVKHLCATCHLKPWKPSKPHLHHHHHHNNGQFFDQPPFSNIHHDFPKFGPFLFPTPNDVFPKMGPIIQKFKHHHTPKIRTVLKIRKFPKKNLHHHDHPPLRPLLHHIIRKPAAPIGYSSRDPFAKINEFQNKSPYRAVSHFPRSSPYPKNYFPNLRPIQFPKSNPYGPLKETPKIVKANHSLKKNPFVNLEEAPPLFSSQFSLADSDINKLNNFNRFPKVSHTPKVSPLDGPLPIPKEFTNFASSGPGFSGFASGKRGHGWGGWDW